MIAAKRVILPTNEYISNAKYIADVIVIVRKLYDSIDCTSENRKIDDDDVGDKMACHFLFLSIYVFVRPIRGLFVPIISVNRYGVQTVQFYSFN